MKKIIRILGFMLAVALTMKEALLIARVTFSEANTESEKGQRLVIDCILNRVDDDEFPDTVEEVINQKGQFSNFASEEEAKDFIPIVFEESNNRANTDVLWFRTDRYHIWGRRIIKEGNHYFSGR